MAFLVAPDDAEAPAAWVAPPQYNLMATVQVAARKDQRAEWGRGWADILDWKWNGEKYQIDFTRFQTWFQKFQN